MTNLVACDQCRFFTPDSIGFGQGIGHCQPYDDYKAKGVSQKSLDGAFRRLGGQLFWPGGGIGYRNCEKFEGLIENA